MTASPAIETAARIALASTDLDHIGRLREMLDGDDLSKDDEDALEFALLQISRLRSLQPHIRQMARVIDNG